MDAIVIFAIIALVLFLLAYIAKRRFGILGLALAAGYVLSKLWETTIPEWAAAIPVDLTVIDMSTVVTLVIILLPSLIVLLGGPNYRTKRGRITGSLLYVTLAIVFSVTSLGYSLVLPGNEDVVFEFLTKYQQYILTIALCVSVIDVVYARSAKADKSAKKH